MLAFPALRSGSLDHRRADEEELHTRADAAHRVACGERNAVAEVCRKMGITEQTFYKVEAAAGGHRDGGADD